MKTNLRNTLKHKDRESKFQRSETSATRVKMAETRSDGKNLRWTQERSKTFKNQAGPWLDEGNKLAFSGSKLTFCLQIFPTVNRV